MITPQWWNEYRIIPRVLIVSYYLFVGFAWAWVVGWFMDYDFTTIKNDTIALAIIAFPATILTVLTTVLGKLTDNYFRTGGNNDR